MFLILPSASLLFSQRKVSLWLPSVPLCSVGHVIAHILSADDETVREFAQNMFVDLLAAVASHPWGTFGAVTCKQLLLLGINTCPELGLRTVWALLAAFLHFSCGT